MRRKDADIDPERLSIEKVDNGAHGRSNMVHRSVGKLTNKFRTRALQLIQRTPLPKPIAVTDFERELETRETLRGIGVPVVPTYRRDPGTGTIYATDLTKGGKNFVLSWENMPLDFEELDAVTNDTWRWEAVPALGEETANKIKRIAETCAAHGIRIKNGDALYLVIDKETRATDVIAGDLKHFERTDTLDPAALRKRNLQECYMILARAQNRHIYGIDIPALKRVFEQE